MARQMQRTQRKTISLLTLDVLHSPVTGYLDFLLKCLLSVWKKKKLFHSKFRYSDKPEINITKPKNILSYFLCFSKLYYFKKQAK